MKILVVKLRNNQARIIKDEFPDLDLTIMVEDTMSQLPAQSARADTIVVMTAFIGHKHMAQLDRGKMFLCNGGLTQLRQQLLALQATSTPPSPKPVKAPAMVKPAKPDKPSKINFSELKKAVPGTVVVFKRPGNMPILELETNVTAARSYYLRKHGVVTSQSTHEGNVEVLVEDNKPVRIEAEAPVPEPAPPFTPLDDYTSQPLPESTGVIEFWQQAYLQSMATLPGASEKAHELAAGAAADALKRYMFPNKEEFR